MNTQFTVRKTSIIGGVIALAACASLLAVNAQQKTATQPAPKAKIGPVEAIRLAKTKVSGRALQANFEFDEGKWVYGVMIVNGKTIKEVEIDPQSGKIGDVETVTPEGEAKEMQDELTKAVGGKVSAKAEAKEADEKDEKDEKSEKQ